jgi:hypothetical protein
MAPSVIWVAHTIEDFFGEVRKAKIRYFDISHKVRRLAHDVSLPAKSANWKQDQSSYLC